MVKKAIATALIIIELLVLLSGCIGEDKKDNKKPLIVIDYPRSGMTVSSFVMISGTVSDPDGDETVVKVEVMINDNKWREAEGTIKWSYDWRTYDINDGMYTIRVRSWDGIDYSEVEAITVHIDNPDIVESEAHKWGLFIAAANFPKDNESKLGNGGLYLAEDIGAYLIENYEYPTSQVTILFDDGWIREENGYGQKTQTLQQRQHEYQITYGKATKDSVCENIKRIVNDANKFDDSEVFIWLFGHGYGDQNKTLTGGKLFESSAIFMWDYETIIDKELGNLLYPLNSKKTCIIVDACFSGGFADRTIYNLPTFFLLKSNIPRSGRIVITGASKFRTGFASTISGPLFSLLWFNGLKSGEADGFRPGFGRMGRPTRLYLFKDKEVSVEEAFYYARYMLRAEEDLEDYQKMEPQINDQYPGSGLFSRQEMLLG